MCHVLIIEDDYLIADFMAWMAETNGAHTTSIAGSEAAAVASAMSQVPDLILSDVNLASGGRGPNAVERIRAKLGDIPVIFVTATPSDCSPCDYASAILDKPVQPERLVAAMHAIHG